MCLIGNILAFKEGKNHHKEDILFLISLLLLVVRDMIEDRPIFELKLCVHIWPEFVKV